MPLAMARPWKHPNSGFYWLRKGVPEDLRQLVGKREEKRSLGTRDPVEAKRRHAEVLAEIETRWANLRAGPKSLTEVEAHQMVEAIHDRWLQLHRDNPSQQTSWRTDLADRLFTPPKALTTDQLRMDLTEIDFEAVQALEMERWCKEVADERLAGLGLVIDDTGRRKLAVAVGFAVQRASLVLMKLARGEKPSGIAALPGPVSQPIPVPQRIVRFDEVVDGWAAERRPVAKTKYEWSRVVRQLARYLGHDEANRFTADNCVEWKQWMIKAGLKPKTIQDSKLAPVRAILQWGVQNKLLPSNPADGISLSTKVKTGERKRGYSDEEAKIILRAALSEKDVVKRWAPWIGAYTGARISEVCQLRSEDVTKIEDIWCFKFVPEAGSVKTDGSERIVPLHPALLENGFLAFVSKVKSGPLFANLNPDKFGKRGGNGTKRIGRFVRQLGLKDPRLSPSHSWRHRIKTLGRKYALAGDLMNAITGHQPETEGDSYGEHPVDALFREISKIPQLKL